MGTRIPSLRKVTGVHKRSRAVNFKEQCGPEKCSSVWFKDWEVSAEAFSLLKAPEASVQPLELDKRPNNDCD